MFKERINFEQLVPKSRLSEGSNGQIEIIPIDVSNKEEYNFVYRSLRKILEVKSDQN